MEKQVLTLDHEKDRGDGNDYTLASGESAWITVGNKSIWIRDLSNEIFGSVSIEVFPKGKEAESEPIDSILV